MNRQSFEVKVRQIVEQLLAGQPNEDSNVEVKGEWIEASKAARQLAGLANAAGGHPVIWVVGIDEKNRKLVSVEPAEQSVWLARIKSRFEHEHMPDPLWILNVRSDLVRFRFEMPISEAGFRTVSVSDDLPRDGTAPVAGPEVTGRLVYRRRQTATISNAAL
jgi:hypothetical protein